MSASASGTPDHWCAPRKSHRLPTCMSKSCSGILDEYITCVADSACVKARLARVCRVFAEASRVLLSPPDPGQRDSRSVKECARDGNAVPECTQKREARAPLARREFHSSPFTAGKGVQRNSPRRLHARSYSSISRASAARLICGHACEATRGTSGQRRGETQANGIGATHECRLRVCATAARCDAQTVQPTMWGPQRLARENKRASMG